MKQGFFVRQVGSLTMGPVFVRDSLQGIFDLGTACELKFSRRGMRRAKGVSLEVQGVSRVGERLRAFLFAFFVSPY